MIRATLRLACFRLLSLCVLTVIPLFAQTNAMRHEEISVTAPFPMPPIKVPVFPNRDFPVTEFGAKAGGEISGAIRRAIAACHAAGGGRVVIPAGNWRSGKVHLKSHVNLHLEKGARLIFSGNPEDYLPAVQSSWEGYECFNYSPLIYAFECENVALTGEGTIEADLTTWKKWMARPAPHLEALKRLYHLASTNAPVAQRQMAEGENNLRPQFIQFNRCRNVRIEGLRIRQSPFWTIHLLLCDSVLVRGLDIYAHGHNTDGIDPEMTRNLLIEDCRFNQGDDAIAIKSGSNQDGWRLGVPTENVVVRNCTVVQGHQLVAIGSELSAGIRNVYVHDCRFENPKSQLQNVLFIKTNLRRGGFVENIHLENIAAGAVRDSVLGIETDVMYQWRTLVPTYEERLTQIRGIHLTNVKVDQTGLAPFRILGDKRAPVRDVFLDHITIGTAAVKQSRYEHAENICESTIKFGVDPREQKEGDFSHRPDGTIKPVPGAKGALANEPNAAGPAVHVVQLKADAGGKRFDGIGVVNGGGATAVLLKDYPEPQRSQILDLVYKPKFGASVSALLVEIPGDGNSTQGSMPSHMHTRDDLNYARGYMWWILQEAKQRNPNLTLDAAAWSAPGWIGEAAAGRFKGERGDAAFWSQDAADYYVKWLQGLRSVYGLELDAIGCRNEKGVSYGFVKALRKSLNEQGFKRVKVHAFDNWPKWKFDFVKDMLTDPELRDAIDIISAHVMYANEPAAAAVQALAAQISKPIWNSEDHIYLKGFDCAISIVECFNENFLRSGATKIVNWYDIAGVYPLAPYAEDPAMLLAHWPWSGHYQVREALWGYAHYGQFTEVGWHYVNGGCGALPGGGTFVTLKSPQNDYSIIIETKGAKAPPQIRFEVAGGWSGKELGVWRSNAKEQFIQQASINPVNGEFTIALDPDSIYSLSTTTGQQKGSFQNIPAPKPFPFPYFETFESYATPKDWGYLPRYTADIAAAFELVDRPDQKGKCLRQVVPIPTISWAPDWLPYTIIGDAHWQDYEVSADVCLNAGDSAAVMGRINHVGTGYGFIPQGYFLQLADDGQCHLVVARGKKDKKKVVGDAEQQRLIAAHKDDGAGGKKVLGTITIPGIRPNQWHNLKLRFAGASITGLVDDKPVLHATDELYSRGMAGLLAGGERKKLSTPYFDNLLINTVNGALPKPSAAPLGQTAIYSTTDSHR